MFRKRRTEETHHDDELPEADPAPHADSTGPTDEATPHHAGVPAERPRSLDTACTCGHTRREHTGLRMEVNGRCLECDCAEFEPEGAAGGSEPEILERIRAAIAHVDLLLEAVATRSRDAPQPQPNGSRERVQIMPWTGRNGRESQSRRPDSNRGPLHYE
jgi:hypothetical protein